MARRGVVLNMQLRIANKSQNNQIQEKIMKPITDNFTSNTSIIRTRTPREVLKSMLVSLSEGNIAEFLQEFDDHFTFTDHALSLEFTHKERLFEFLQRSRELFPDTMIEVGSTFEHRDHAIAEWRLVATENVSYGSMKFRLPISLSGVSVVQIGNEGIIRW